MNSSSIHHLNADKGLNFFAKFAYLFLNWVNNLRPYANLDKRVKIESFSSPNWHQELDHTYASSSVPRRVSDLFGRTLPWEKIKRELGEINIFDTGCGHGNYGVRLSEASKGLVDTYTGVDAKERPNWVELRSKYPNFTLIESNSDDISNLIPENTNFFFTQSAIEHFDNDLLFFKQIRSFIDKHPHKPIIQIHIFPAAATLPLYLFHGLRQYTPRNISKITRLFDDSTHLHLFGLGGTHGAMTHFKYFTWPQLILRGKSRWSDDEALYDKEVRQSIEEDIKNPSASPLFWALVIHSHPKGKIW